MLEAIFITISNVGIVFTVQALLRFNLRKLKKEREASRLAGESPKGGGGEGKGLSGTTTFDPGNFLSRASSTATDN